MCFMHLTRLGEPAEIVNELAPGLAVNWLGAPTSVTVKSSKRSFYTNHWYGT